MSSSTTSNLWIIVLFLCTLNHGLLCAHFVDVGIILDMESWIGKSIHSCILMAISDFYALNDGYETRIVVHTRDTKGDPLQTISHALDLLNILRVNAIIGPETYTGSNLLTSVTHEAKIPIFSFAAESSVKYPYLFRIKEDEIAMAKCVAALIESFKWRDVIYIYEDTDNGLETLQYLYDSFQDKNIRIVYKSDIFDLATNKQVIEELHKIMNIHTSVIIVNVSPLLASRLLVNAKTLGMMNEEYAWILTQKTSEIMQSPEFEVIESLQGVIGVRSHMPASSKLHNFKKRFHKEYFFTEVPMLAIWAYDTIWALAESIERVGVPENASLLSCEIMKTRFNGVSGDFQLKKRKLISNGFDIINAVDHGERKVGYWTSSKGIRRAHDLPLNDVSLRKGIEDVIWPGGSTTTPKGWILRMSIGNTLRIGVPIGVKFKYFVDASYDAEKNVTTVTGFSVDVFNTCIHALPYEVPYVFIPLENINERYDDNLINKVYIREIDGVLGDTTILSNRSEYVDFTTSYTDVGIGTLTKIKEEDSGIFLKPLNVDLWLTFVFFGFLTVFTIWAIESMGQKPERRPPQGIGRISWLILLTIFFAQRDKLSKSMSRFVMFVWLILVLVLITSYTATLTSLLTVKQFELASKGGIIGFHGGSFFGGVTINNVKLADNMQKAYYSYEAYANALSQGGKHGGADAIIDEVPYIKMFLGRHSDDYAMVLSEPITSGFGFIFAKGSPLTADISRQIAKIREDGTLINLEKKWFEKEFPLLSQDSIPTPKTLDLNSFRGLFVFIGGCFAFALIVSALYVGLAKMEVRNIIQFLVGHDLMLTIRYLLYRRRIIIIQR